MFIALSNCQVSAAKRPKNSALEVDLDFEHNVRPVPQTTEESTASLEDLIKKRIVEVCQHLCGILSFIDFHALDSASFPFLESALVICYF